MWWKHLSGLLSNFKNIDEFIINYKLPDDIISELIKFTSIKEIQGSTLSKASSEFVKSRIKAMLARIQWNESTYYQVLNTQDEYVLKAIKSLNK